VLRKTCEEGEDLMNEKKWVQALVKYDEALALLPPPHEQWRLAKRIYSAQGDAYFHLKDWQEAVRCMTVARAVDESANDAFILLRLGQAQLELGHAKAAAEMLATAHKLGGDPLFAKEDAKYKTAFAQG
jgi:tetratricopeptide (TPR) repeat protein